MSTSYYDVVVAGTDLCGLVAGALCAKRGYRVLVLGQDCRRAGYTGAGGFQFQRRPSLIYGLQSSSAVEAVLDELGLSIEMRNRMRLLRPSHQIVLPALRLDWYPDREALAGELKRELPGRQPEVDQYLRLVGLDNDALDELFGQDFPIAPQGFRQRREFARTAGAFDAKVGLPGIDLLGPLSAADPLRWLLALPQVLLQRMPLEQVAYFPWIRTARQVQRGFWYLEGGFDRLAQLFVDRIITNCGVFRPEGTIQQLEFKRGTVRELTLLRDEQVGCGLLIVNCDPRRVFGLVPEHRQERGFHDFLQQMQTGGYLITLNVAIGGPLVTEGMASIVFLASDLQRAAQDDNALLLVHEPVTYSDAQGAPYRLLTVSALLPPAFGPPTVEFARDLQTRMLARVRQVVPFLDQITVAVDFPWIRRHPLDGSFYLDPREVAASFQPILDGTLGASSIGPRTPYDNVLLGSDHLMSGFGPEGSFLAGLALARNVGKQLVLRTILHG